MNTLSIHLENCYGIKKLIHTFDLTRSKDHVIYAPNGCMKSSFAKTLEDISIEKSSVDRIFTDRISHRSVQVDGRDIAPNEIFVINRMKEAEFKEASTILANEQLKNEYDSINSSLNENKNRFIKNLQAFFGVKENQIEPIIAETFSFDIFTTLEKTLVDIESIENPIYTNIVLSEIFNEKVIKFLGEKSFNLKIREYISTYDKLVDENASFFKRGAFNHFNAETITKSLKDNGFFSASHKVKIKNTEIESAQELETLVKEEKEKVLSSPDLVAKFNAIDKALNANSELRKFRQYITENQEIIKEFVDLPNFKKKLIINYLAANKHEAIVLLSTYNTTKEKREKLIQEAKSEQAEWIKVLKIFQNRFSAPFKIRIKNQEDVILKNEAASLVFTYSDGTNEIDLGGTDINNNLSTGEQRVFYLLNIIFQLEARQRMNIDQLVVVDDIADSFDYKNKYAIIEYLKDISENSHFKLIILTHNFDFYKTLKTRIKNIDNWHGNHIAVKTSNGIAITAGETRDVFDSLKRNFSTCQLSFIACIPFVRNLIEYTIGASDQRFAVLTSILHFKPYNNEKAIKATTDHTVGEILAIFNMIFNLNATVSNQNDKVFDLIHIKAQALIASPEPILDIKSKLCLSIAIRHIAEDHIISKVQDAQFHAFIQKKETGKIVEQYRKEFHANSIELEIFDRVNLMTAENIHINSFMYEPLMDLSDAHLRRLYADVSGLVVPTRRGIFFL